MIQVLRWLARRARCTLLGHDPESARIYYPPAKSITRGYRCEKCGKTQLLCYRWQKPQEGDEGDE